MNQEILKQQLKLAVEILKKNGFNDILFGDEEREYVNTVILALLQDDEARQSILENE